MAQRLLSETDVWAFLLGVCIGFVSSMPPIGPGGLMLMRRGLEGRFREGLALAAGGATADGIYCALAVVGFNYLVWKHPDLTASMRWVGVAILAFLAIWFLTRKPEAARGNGNNHVDERWPRQLLLGFSVTAFNPTLLITWSTAIAVIAGLGGDLFTRTGRVSFPIGVAIGDMSWALVALLSWRRLGRFLSARVLFRLMRAIGLVLFGLAVFFATKTILEPVPSRAQINNGTSRASDASSER